ADPMVPHPFRIKRTKRETQDTYTVELVPLRRGLKMGFAPGQFNMIYVPGIGEVPISISGDPVDPIPVIHTVRAAGTVTTALCKMKAGDVVGIRGPYGSHWPVRESAGNDIVIVAGGIGLAPLRPAIYQLLSQRDHYGRLAFLCGTRTPREILYRHELEKWRSRFDLDVEITVDHPGEDWYGRVGVVTTLIPLAGVDPFDTTALVCGPEVMIRFTVAKLRQRGISTDNIYVSMERNMKCGIGLCGHCQYGREFVCKDGPVFPFSRIERFFKIREL
ncbi:MAG: FAD/NAD(P)-binding protein, partial [Candidatus Latescibacterota bacterium]